MSGSGARIALSEHELVDDQGRLAAAALRRMARDADHVAEMDVDLARARERAHELDPARTVDEIEEDELSHVSASEHATRQPPRLGRLDPRLEHLRLGPHRGDLVAVRKALRRHSGHGRLTIAQARGPPFGVSPSRTTSKPCPR